MRRGVKESDNKMNSHTVSHGTGPVDLCHGYDSKNIAVVVVTVLLLSYPGE